MAKQFIFLLLALATFGFFGYTARRIFSYFKLTKAESRFDRLGERTSLMLRVAFGQTKILRKPIAGLLHALVYWGFLVITVGTLEMIIDGLFGTHRILGSFLGPVYDFITLSGEIFAVIIIAACIIFLIRRYIIKPTRFTAPEMKPSSRWDATLILGMILLLMFSLIGMNMGHIVSDPATPGSYPVSRMLVNMGMLSAEAAPAVGEANWWIHVTLVLVFLNVLPLSKHFHVILAIPNVFFSKLTVPGQLGNMESVKQEVKLMMDPEAPMPEEDGSDPERFGVKDVEDISWKTLMDSYTCTECGRCTSVCPANITGKKLSPRKIYIDTRARMKEKGPELVAHSNSGSEEPYDDGKSLVGDYITPEELWACTTCGACMQECPVNIEHVPHIINMRRFLVMEESNAPEHINIMFNNIENNGAPWAMPASERFAWADEIYLPE